MGSVIQQIGESFEQIGKDVVHETVQAPKDLTGKALESLGLSGGKKNPKQQKATVQTTGGQEGIAGHQEITQSDEIKRAVARAALEELIGKKPKEKELSIWEKIQKEDEQKKELMKKQKEEAAKKELPTTSSKRPRGDLFGKRARQTQVESKAKRQD